MKSKTLIINLTISLTSLVILLLILEVVFRLPSIKQKTGGHWPVTYKWMIQAQTNELNSLGFRDSEHQLKNPDNTYRILVLGDSYVYGQMVPSEKFFTRQLENLLNKHFDQNIEVISMGLMGWNTVEQLEALQTHGLKFKPDLVIIGFVLNDLQIKNNPNKLEAQDPEKPILPFKKLDSHLDKKSYFYSFTKYQYNRVLEKYDFKVSYDLWQRRLYQNNRAINQFTQAIIDINSLSQSIGAQVLFADLNLLLPESDWRQEKTLVLNLVDNLGLSILDLGSFLSDYSHQEITISKSDGHPNILGHQIYAQALADYISVNLNYSNNQTQP